MDPLILLDQAVAQEKVPRALVKKVRLRMRLLQGAVERVEKASGLRYPPYYIEPTLPVSKSGSEYGQMGVLFARVIPTAANGSVLILVQFTAALVAFGTKGTLDAVAAHEFTHYVDLVRKFSTTDVTSDEAATTLYEAAFADAERVTPPRLIFSDKALVSLISRKFKNELSDEALNKKVGAGWIAKNLPIRLVGPEENRVSLPMDAVAATRFDPAVLAKVTELREKARP
ncbi:MAG: hypothetical protein JRN34_04205 [Nitrososphaerota archaeon]|nr:hypothetical protein [Nitrososphaerota archaeon]MDG6942110.1 hypothetical protein [Nitrososphaerota archaeon]MDG6942575.1 hypothetical protein [Nitrososphaerota archaeon]MDG6948362.1 hypothetical protein [Nitrososphaerota archaeon]MDG6950288.1 hypothetical protein [Nitrososphaerota archaeon]